MSHRARVIVAGAALALQLVVLYLPRAPAVGVEGLPQDKVAHVVVFALPTYTLIRAGLTRSVVISLMLGQALASELIQHLAMADRSGDPADVLADLVGVLIGVILVRRRSGQAATSPSISPVG